MGDQNLNGLSIRAEVTKQKSATNRRSSTGERKKIERCKSTGSVKPRRATIQQRNEDIDTTTETGKYFVTKVNGRKSTIMRRPRDGINEFLGKFSTESFIPSMDFHLEKKRALGSKPQDDQKAEGIFWMKPEDTKDVKSYKIIKKKAVSEQHQRLRSKSPKMVSNKSSKKRAELMRVQTR